MRQVLIAAAIALAANGADFPAGQIVDDVKCAAEPTQSYALYLPSNYSADRQWPVIFAFSPMARGRIPVERFQQAAEKYGYLIAGSNNSRNGDWQVSLAAIRSMPADVTSRFSVDQKRVYTAGMSGGARVAMQVALASGKIAGVVACSAGFPDAQPRRTVPFLVFGTAGTEDFNYLEMRRLDRALTSPHRVVIFDGSHEWLSSDLAVQAVEWLELEAMKSGLQPRDDAFIARIFTERLSQASGQPTELKSLAADFEGLRDTTQLAAQAAELEHRKDAVAAAKKERSLEAREEQMIGEIAGLENGLAVQSKRADSLTELRDRLSDLAHRASATADSPERRLARRVLRGTFVRSFEQLKDPDYQKLLDKLRAEQER